MYIGWYLRKWIIDYLQVECKEFNNHFDFEIVSIEGHSPPSCYKYAFNHRELRNRIQVTDNWIKMNVPKEILAASIAERMLHVEKSYDSQFSLA